MRIMSYIAASLVLAFHAFPAEAEQIQGSQFSSGNWNGAAYTFDASGEFSHCAISASYKSGNTLYFSVTRDASVTVGVSGPALGLEEGMKFPVTLAVDRRKPFYGTATAVSSNLAFLTIADFDAAMTAFKKGYTLRIFANGGQGVYDLSGTFRALEAARNCAIMYYNHRSKPSTASTRNEVVDPAIGYQLATSMISDLGVTDARYLTKDELQQIELPGAVYWVSNDTGLSGGVMFFDVAEGYELRTHDAVATEYLSRDCDGDIASTVQQVDAEFPARQIRVLCLSDDQQYEAYLTNSLLEDVRMVTLLMHHSDVGGAAPEKLKERSTDLALRNAKFVLDAE